MPLSESLRLKLLWLFLAVSALAAIEPSPYEGMFFVCLLAFARGGLVFDTAHVAAHSRASGVRRGGA